LFERCDELLQLLDATLEFCNAAAGSQGRAKK
jgi:hypothetical protein